MNKQIALMIFRWWCGDYCYSLCVWLVCYYGDVAKADESFVFFIIHAGLIVLVGIKDIILTKRAN